MRVPPDRNDEVTTWLMKRRDEFDPILQFQCWSAIDDLLDEWRLWADTGQPVGGDREENG